MKLTKQELEVIEECLLNDLAVVRAKLLYYKFGLPTMDSEYHEMVQKEKTLSPLYSKVKRLKEAINE